MMYFDLKYTEAKDLLQDLIWAGSGYFNVQMDSADK